MSTRAAHRAPARHRGLRGPPHPRGGAKARYPSHGGGQGRGSPPTPGGVTVHQPRRIPTGSPPTGDDALPAHDRPPDPSGGGAARPVGEARVRGRVREGRTRLPAQRLVGRPVNSLPRTARTAVELLSRIEATGRGADVGSYQGKRARAYPPHELEDAGGLTPASTCGCVPALSAQARIRSQRVTERVRAGVEAGFECGEVRLARSCHWCSRGRAFAMRSVTSAHGQAKPDDRGRRKREITPSGAGVDHETTTPAPVDRPISRTTDQPAGMGAEWSPYTSTSFPSAPMSRGTPFGPSPPDLPSQRGGAAATTRR